MDLTPHLGSRRTLRLTVRPEHTVPALPLDTDALAGMPAVLATPVLVAMAEHACMAHIAALDQAAGLSLGAEVRIAHIAATPVGLTVAIETELAEVRGRLVTFAFTAHDGIEAIGHGRHTRALVDRARFEQKLAEKRAQVD